MLSIIEHVVASVSIGAITLTTVFAFVGRRVFEHVLQRNVEYLKIELTQAAQISKERLTAIHQIKFDRLLKLYDATAKLTNTLSGFVILTKQSHDVPDDVIRLFAEKYVAFSSAVADARPFLTDLQEHHALEVTIRFDQALAKIREDRNVEELRVQMNKIESILQPLQREYATIVRNL